MKTSEIKNNLHSLIDSIDNEKLLMKFYDLMTKSSSNKEGELWKRLTEEEKSILLVSESESKYEKNLIDFESQKDKHKKWL